MNSDSSDPFISFTDSSSGSPVKKRSSEEANNSPEETPKRKALPARPIQLKRKFNKIEKEEIQQHAIKPTVKRVDDSFHTTNDVEFILKQKLLDIDAQIESLSQIMSCMSCPNCSLSKVNVKASDK